MRYRNAPAHVKAAIRDAAARWETTDGTPLTDLLNCDGTPGQKPNQESDPS